MREAGQHPTTESLESYAEGTLPAADRAVVASHLMSCVRCDSEVEDWRSLFQALATLPHFAPALGFANRVMAHVRIPEPWHARASGWLERYPVVPVFQAFVILAIGSVIARLAASAVRRIVQGCG